MAIEIPSKNIYELNNKKVLDNVIERIEVRAVEVVPDNEYDTPVYNERFDNFSLVDTNGDPAKKDIGLKTEYKHTGVGTNSSTVAFGSYCAYHNYKKSSFALNIPRLKGKSIVNSIMYGVDKDDNPYIKHTVYCSKKTGKAIGALQYGGGVDGFTGLNSLTLEEGATDTTKNYSIPTIEEYKYEGTNSITGLSGTVTSTATFYNKGGSIITATPTINEDNITINIDFVSSVTVVKLGTNPVVVASGSFQASGTYEEYIPTRIEITIYGNTIGIDLQDKTVYIPSDNKAIKKVFSVEGNELMQTSNTVSLEEMYSNTQKAYANGKETATIRCSISKPVNKILESGVGYVEEVDNYYDPATDSEIRIITITLLEKTKKPVTVKWYIGDGSGGINTTVFNPNESIVIRAYNCFIDEVSIVTQMAFEIYDQVIPMVYGADGEDRAMSLKKDGKTPKEFNVLGTKIYYDGAVWQELYLQEA